MNKKLLAVIKEHYAGLTQKQVSKITGMPESDVSLIWTGKRGLTVETICRLCDAQNVKGSEVWAEAENV